MCCCVDDNSKGFELQLLNSSTSEIMTIYSLYSLPLELIFEIQYFLKDGEFLLLLNTSKFHFGNLRLECNKFSITAGNNHTVSNFVNDLNFQAKILKTVKDPLNQITLSTVYKDEINRKILEFPSYGLEAHNFWGGYKLLKSDFPLINQRKYLSFRGNDEITSFDGIAPTVQKMKLLHFNALVDVKDLSHLQELELDNCTALKDVSFLGGLKVLKISDCPEIVDISSLGNIHNLTILACDGITNINGLKNNYYLTILDCLNIQEIDSLKYATHLKTDLFHQYKDTEILSYNRTRTLHMIRYSDKTFYVPKSLYRLYLEDCGGIKEISNVPHLLELTLECCKSLIHLKNVSKIAVITLDECDQLEDISGLGENKFVTIYCCDNIHDFSSLKNISKVHIIGCDGFVNIQDVSHVKHLIIESCNNMKELKSLMKTEILQLVSFPIKSIDGLISIQNTLKELEIFHCPMLSNFKILPSLTKIQRLTLSDYHYETIKRKNKNYLENNFHLEQIEKDLFLLLRKE